MGGFDPRPWDSACVGVGRCVGRRVDRCGSVWVGAGSFGRVGQVMPIGRTNSAATRADDRRTPLPTAEDLLSFPTRGQPRTGKCGCSSVVECHLAKVNVEGSNPFTRSFDRNATSRGNASACRFLVSSHPRGTLGSASSQPRTAAALERIALRPIARDLPPRGVRGCADGPNAKAAKSLKTRPSSACASRNDARCCQRVEKRFLLGPLISASSRETGRARHHACQSSLAMASTPDPDECIQT